MFNIAKKDLLLFIRDRRGLILSFLLPIVLITLFALAFGGVAGGKKRGAQTLLLVDEDSTELSLSLSAKLDSLPELKIEPITIGRGTTAVQSGKRMAVLIIRAGLKDSVDLGKQGNIELFYDQSREMEMGILQMALQPTLMDLIGFLQMEKQVMQNMDEMLEGVDSTAKAGISGLVEEQFATLRTTEGGGMPGQVDIGMRPLNRAAEKNWRLIQSVAGTAILMLLFTVASIGASILTEKEQGTLRRLLYSPMGSNQILLGKLFTAVTIAIVQLLFMFLFAWIAFGLDIFQNLPAMFIMILAAAFACSAFGIFIAAICRTRKQVESISMLVILIMSMIGGSMLPLFIMPEFMQKIAGASVNYWAIQGFFDIFWRELPTGQVLTNALVLVGIGAVLTIISIKLFQRNIVRLA